MSSRLGEFRELVKEVARSACRTAMVEAGYTPDYNSEELGSVCHVTQDNWLNSSVSSKP